LVNYHSAMHLCFGTTPTVQQTMIFDRVVADEVNRAVEVRRASAGKPINVARVLHTLGEPAMVCVPLGGDTGRFIGGELAASGVDLDAVETPNATRTCVTIIDRQAGSVTELVEEHAAIPSAARSQLLAELKSQLPKCRSLILSGKLAPGAGDDFYAECCRAAPTGVSIVLDARGEGLMRALPVHPLVVKPNRAELAGTLGIDIGDDAALRRAIIELVGRGARWAVITMGKGGAIASDGKSFWKIPAIEVAAISAIGSGDAFSAGLAAGIVAGRDVPEACLLATACAAANTLIPGAGFLRLEDVQRLQPLARAEKW
jgi:1-phosphofructokinase family hexose kinase